MQNTDERIVRNIIESLSVGLMVISPSGVIVMHNAALCTILDIPAMTLSSASWAELFIEDVDRNTDFNQVILDVIEKRAVEMRHIVVYENTGGKRRRLCITSSFLQEGEELVAIVFLIEDVTDKYEMLEKENDYLRKIQGLQLERIEGLNKLAMSMAHQIRNPLMSIGGSSNFLLKNLSLDQRERDLFDSILQGAHRLESIVQAARSFASILEPRQQEVPLANILKMSCEKANAFSVDHGRSVAWDMPSIDLQLQVDPDLFEKALSVLLFNSIEFNAKNEVAISISAMEQDGETLISVTDLGIGISSEDIPYVFDPFYSTKPDGIGMGLTVARRIVMEHGGEITLTSVAGKGATATIVIPCSNSNSNLCSLP